MNFPSIDIQGSILSGELLAHIRTEQATFQLGKDFKAGLTNAKLKDEISYAWQEAKGQWLIYKSKLNRLAEGESATTETRNFWIMPLLSNLGYNLSFNRQAQEINNKTFAISHADTQRDNFPVYIGGYYESLDKRPENRYLRVSPHALLQEYLNASEHLYGLITNGKHLRLLRDASRITRLSYVEFNLEKIMEEDLYADFVILFRLLHVSRMPQTQAEASESIIEKYHQDSLAAGSTIRHKLGDAVKEVIVTLANAFLEQPDNVALRKAANENNFDLDLYYRHQLRIIYRFLFLFVIEERNLVYADAKTPESKRFHHIYTQYFSLNRLRLLAKKLPPTDAHRHDDLWQGMSATFSFFEQKSIGEKLGIMALQGELFSYNALTSDSYDLHKCSLNNKDFLAIIKALSYFENDKGVISPINYKDLDVEEFGSVYEGLLELNLQKQKIEGSDLIRCALDTSNERGKSGSHYTPEELVQPLIKHSLEHLIAERAAPYYAKKATKELTIKALLELKVCDVACGSGHILLNAARRIALEIARVETDEEQPNPATIRKAIKSVIRACIYGVDKNPLAIELCKIALWLESHHPGEPLNFLDHHIKCGDAIVGLGQPEELTKGIPTEAFKALAGDEKEIAAKLSRLNKKERENRMTGNQTFDFQGGVTQSLTDVWEVFQRFNQMPENTLEEITEKEKAYKKLFNSHILKRLHTLADIQTAVFFLPKTKENENDLVTDETFFRYLNGKEVPFALEVKNITLAARNRFFHWFLEFPDVFLRPQIAPKIKPTQNSIFQTAEPQTLIDFANKPTPLAKGGFDCILGNPPFLGGQKLSGTYGNPFLEYIKYEFAPIGAVDLVTYFFRRIFSLLQAKGFLSLISTNSIAQGSAREGGLDIIVAQGGTINHAVKSMRWPGKAAVEVALVSISKQVWQGKFILNGKEASTITPYLDDANTLGNPFPLKQNENKSFQGSIVLGKGFVLTPTEAQSLIARNPINKDVLFPYLNGDDLNNAPDQSPSRWVINFFNFPLKRYTETEWAELPEMAREDILKRIKKEQSMVAAPPTYKGKVAADYPDCLEIIERLVKPQRAKDNRQSYRDYWWLYAEKRSGLYITIFPLKKVLVACRVSKYVNHTFTEKNMIFDVGNSVVARETYVEYLFLMNSLHNEWAWKYASTLESRIRYVNVDCIDTFPFPQNLTSPQEAELESIGEAYHTHRKALMQAMKLGLTKTYNLFHSEGIRPLAIDEKDKQVIALQKHLAKTPEGVSFQEAVGGILELRKLHLQMDMAVLAAYGWQDIPLRHDFYDLEYLPEGDRRRYTLHPDARKEVLKRLLSLNHSIHAEEVAAGLWDKKKTVYKQVEEVSEVAEAGEEIGSLFE